MLNVSDAVNEVYEELNLIGQQIDQTDVFLYLKRSVNYFSTAYAFPTAKRSFDTLFFNGVRQIGVPSDFCTLIEPKRPPALHSPRFMAQTSRELNSWPYGRKLAVEYEGSTIYLDVVDDCDSTSFLLAGCDDTTGVTVSGDGSNLSVDNMIYTQGTGSLRFQITPVTGQTVLTFSMASSFDITTMLTKDWGFCDLIAPSSNSVAIANMKFRIGNDATHYHEMTATTRYRGDAILDGISQVGFDLTARVDTGVVTDTAINWMQIVINHGVSGVSGIYHLDNIFLSQGFFVQVPYYSENNIEDVNGIAKSTVDALTDIILLPKQCNEAIIYKTLELAAMSPNIKDESFANDCARELVPKESILESLYPMERILIQSQWYKKTNFKRRGYSYR